MAKVLMVWTTFSSMAEGREVAAALLERRLVACVNFFPVTSAYRWEGEIREEDEVQAVMKTAAERLEELERELVVRHSYEVPEFLVVEVVAGSEGYLGWVGEQLRIEN